MTFTMTRSSTVRQSLLLLLISALLLGGCHPRSGGCHAHSHHGSDKADAVLVAFYVFYLLGWIIVNAADG